MLRSVEEIRTQTREAYEDFVMEKVDEASRAKKADVTLDVSLIPNWLAKKLSSYGYRVHFTGDHNVNIYWGTDAE